MRKLLFLLVTIIIVLIYLSYLPKDIEEKTKLIEEKKEQTSCMSVNFIINSLSTFKLTYFNEFINLSKDEYIAVSFNGTSNTDIYLADNEGKAILRDNSLPKKYQFTDNDAIIKSGIIILNNNETRIIKTLIDGENIDLNEACHLNLK